MTITEFEPKVNSNHQKDDHSANREREYLGVKSYSTKHKLKGLNILSCFYIVSGKVRIPNFTFLLLHCLGKSAKEHVKVKKCDFIIIKANSVLI